MNYDLKYYYKMLRDYTPTAPDICRTRWNFIEQVGPTKVLDYGCGIGWFKAFAPDYVEVVDTFDIMPVPQTGITQEKYDVVCFWDVLEHIPDFSVIEGVLDMTKYVALTIPIKPKSRRMKFWKHFKPGEHLHYFTTDLLIDFFDAYNFALLHDAGTIECPPREDVYSFLFERYYK